MSWQASVFHTAFRLGKWMDRGQTAQQFVDGQRRFTQRVSPFCKVPKHCEHSALRVGKVPSDMVPCEWIVHHEAHDSKRVILYFHGGAYVMGGIKTHYELAAQLSAATKSRVLLVDYRVAPEHPFPAALDDAMACYCYLLEQKFDAKNIVIAGDSAGGNLTLVTLLKIRDDGLPMARAGVCFSPWCDLTHSAESHRTNRDSDTMINMAVIPDVATMYAGKAALTHPLISPLFADLHGLPPLFINASTSEVLRDDAIRIAAKAQEQGVTVELSMKENLPHAYPGMCRALPEARATIRDVAVFLNRVG